MEYFSINAFILGALLTLCIYVSLIIYSAICIFFKIRIVEFSTFSNPWFSLYSKSISGTKYTLGWLPFGGYIKPLGMVNSNSEKSLFEEKELPYVFFNKPAYVRILFSLTPTLTFLAAFLISISLYSGLENFWETLRLFTNYILEALSTIFGDHLRDGFLNTTHNLRTEKNIVLFSFTILSFVVLLLQPLTYVLGKTSNGESNSTLTLIFQMILLVATIVLYWKIFSFVFSFFSFSANVVYVISAILGMYALSTILFPLSLLVLPAIVGSRFGNQT